MATFRLAVAAASVAAGATVVAPGAARAQPATAVASPPADVSERTRREEALRLIEQNVRANAESRTRLEREVASLRGDGTKLAAALVAAAHRARSAEERVRSAESRLDELLAGERGIRRSLDARRGALAQVLAALQRLGLHPPPALLVRPRDVLDAVRTASLLGALTPGLREEARRLSVDLAELARIRTAIEADRAALDAEFATLAGERDRLSALIAARQERLASAEAEIRRERLRAETLGREARSLRELIERTEAERGRPGPGSSDAAPPGGDEARLMRERFAAAALREPVRLSPRMPFPELRGSLGRPASGPVLREFGAPDGTGGHVRGVAFGTRPRAVVTAPSDGTIVFAGPFRAYGRVLIINVGGGYYFLLTGLDRISVETGQFVLAGEPVAAMGEVAAPSAALGVVEADGPILYVELRKDGAPIDPGPWWAKSLGERARG